MFFIITLIGTAVLLSMFKITGSVIVGVLVSLAVYILTDLSVVAFLVYFISIIPWGKFDEKRRVSSMKRVFNNRSDDSYNNGNGEAIQAASNIYGRGCPNNVYYIGTLNINNAPQQQYLPQATNVCNDYIEDSQNNGWKITSVDWEALEKDLRSQGR